MFSSGSTTLSEMPKTVVEAAMSTEILDGSFTYADSIAVLLVLAAFVKSAQMGFHMWLPDAMEGPTPVSALLHAATMVTAGVYLVIRFSFVVEYSLAAKALLVVVGFLTIVISSLIAMAQYDIKKIIAYSTCSQLGLMFYACGLSGYDLALFHFFNHAFFKCALFLLAGVMIHELKNEQDIRRMGGIYRFMPVTSIFFIISSMSLVGFPGFSGAVSKDAIFGLVNFTAVNSES
jgi:NADH:ubiquinone oxidoreductase subunit 5 (subunit L)/multisubunit Na+/H+ antiporter MnhA subunit